MLTSMLTGEPMQVAKHKGDKVFAGTINKNGAITVCVTADADTTLLARIVDSVRDAQGSKAPVQRVADVISRYFTYVVVTFAAITLIGWIIAGGSVATAVICAVSVLVIACPCALRTRHANSHHRGYRQSRRASHSHQRRNRP